MIRVRPQSEPATFDARVRTPGRQFLREHPKPTSRQWKNRDYWTRILLDLHNAYGGICAYRCHWMPFDTGNRTVEHFRPKSVSPNLAYEWSNYRLVCGTLNGRRGSDLDVLDPFRVQDGWFILDFPSVLVRPNPTLSARRTARVLHTIEKLGLNDEGTCRKMRLRYVKEFCTHQVTFEYLQTDAPFLAKEIQRLGLEKSLAAMMGY